MKEIYKNLYVGKAEDAKDWDGYLVCAAKEPFHREALGYKTQAAPKDHPEYLIARRGKTLILNLIDANDAKWIPEAAINEAIAFIQEHMITDKVLIVCNQGQSRSPSLAMLAIRDKLPFDFNQAMSVFIKAYPEYAPSNGLKNYVEQHWYNS